jgi:hypothetical protein
MRIHALDRHAHVASVTIAALGDRLDDCVKIGAPKKMGATPPCSAPRARVDAAMVKALARGFRWRKMLETGVYATSYEIAVAEKINRSYISGLLRLTLLAPDIVEAVLDGQAPTIIAQDISLRSLPNEWDAQRRMLADEM